MMNEFSFIWDKTGKYHKDEINLRLALVNYGCECESLSQAEVRILDSESLLKHKHKLYAIERSFRKLDSSLSVGRMTPPYIKQKILEDRYRVIDDLGNYVQNIEGGDKFLRFISDPMFSVINHFDFNIPTLLGENRINLIFAKNYRFKAARDTLNLFNMPKFERKILIPIKDDHILYSADFKQFESRTFLKIHPEAEIPKSKDIYEHLAEKFNMEKKFAKQRFIAYIYGAEDIFLDQEYNRDEMIPDKEIVEVLGYPIVIDPNIEPHKKLHTVVQTVSQYEMIKKMRGILDLLEDFESELIFPLHDELIFSVKKKEINDLIPKIREIMIDETYKVHEYFGKNFKEMRKL